MTHRLITIYALVLTLLLTDCGEPPAAASSPDDPEGETAMETEFTADTPIQAVIDDPAFGDYGRLLFPADDGYWSGRTLGDLRLAFYSHIDPDETLDIVNTLKARAQSGETVFYDIYTAEEKAQTRTRRIQVCSFSGVNRMPDSLCATPAVLSPMWGLCTTAFPTRWSCPDMATMPLH